MKSMINFAFFKDINLGISYSKSNKFNNIVNVSSSYYGVACNLQVKKNSYR